MEICLECGKEFKSKDPVASHITRIHKMTQEEYYLKHISSEVGKCVICGNPTRFLNIFKGYAKTCSAKCVGKLGPIAIMKKYGVSSVTKLPEIRKKIEETCEKKYGKGITTPLKSKEIQEKCRNSVKERYGINNAFLMKDENGNIKREKTYIERYGFDNPLKVPEIAKRVIEKKIELYGTSNIFEKSKNTVKEKYGVDNAFLIKDPDGIEKRVKTWMERYGVDSPMKVREYYLKTRQKYHSKDGNNYDSSWEYIFEQYLKSIGIKYQYHPEVDLFWKDVNGKTHRYYPDFLLIDSKQLIEIKGDHFFDENGDFIDPYNRTEIGSSNAKLKFEYMKSIGVKIITSKEFDFYGYAEYNKLDL